MLYRLIIQHLLMYTYMVCEDIHKGLECCHVFLDACLYIIKNYINSISRHISL